MSIDRFQMGLAEVIGEKSSLRPFVCEGSPLECDVFIVGYNPATRMDGDWWQFWKPSYGYQKSLWRKEYLLQRGGEMSKTRRRIESIVEKLAPARVLEANIDSRPSKRKSEYPRPLTAPFDYLLSVCRPTVGIAHGVDAVAYLQTWSSSTHIIPCKHFIYVGHERTEEIVAETLEALAKRSSAQKA